MLAYASHGGQRNVQRKLQIDYVASQFQGNGISAGRVAAARSADRQIRQRDRTGQQVPGCSFKRRVGVDCRPRLIQIVRLRASRERWSLHGGARQRTLLQQSVIARCVAMLMRVDRLIDITMSKRCFTVPIRHVGSRTSIWVPVSKLTKLKTKTSYQTLSGLKKCLAMRVCHYCRGLRPSFLSLFRRCGLGSMASRIACRTTVSMNVVKIYKGT